MFYCKDCEHFEICKHHGQTVDYAVDDGVCRYFEKDTNVLTNADRIRAMSDEELVNIVPCPLGFSMFRCTKNQKCKDCKKEWLKQPAEDK